jgi:hypothetical protein
MEFHDLEKDLFKYAKEAGDADLAYVKTNEVFQILHDHKDILFKRLASQYNCKTTAEKERSAALSDEWKEFMEGYQVARIDAEMAKVKRNTAIRNWETTRSILSSKNIERRFTN